MAKSVQKRKYSRNQEEKIAVYTNKGLSILLKVVPCFHFSSYRQSAIHIL